jgi:hypothetical protein
VDRQAVEPSDRVAEADWIAPRLHPFGVDVASVVPAGFESYARLSHQPQTGVLPEPASSLLAALLAKHTSTPDRCWLCLWDGYGYLHRGGAAWMVPARRPMTFTGLRWWQRISIGGRSARRTGPPGPQPPPPPPLPEGLPAESRPRVHLPERDFLLFAGSVAQAAGWQDGPNLWWPEDRAWCVASEIDLTDTFVGGPAPLIERILTEVALGGSPAAAEDPLVVSRPLSR